MSNFRRIVFLALIATLLLAACTRQASKSPADSPLKAPNSTPLVLDPIAATQTAQVVISQFNQPTQMVPNAKGTMIAITAIPATPAPIATPTPVGPTPTPVEARPSSYTVRPGESPNCLARRFDVDPEALLKANNLTETSIINVGQVLKIPLDTNFPGDRRVPGTVRPDPEGYWVSPGETIYMVACYYGDILPEEIIKANNLKEPYDISDIKNLVIP